MKRYINAWLDLKGRELRALLLLLGLFAVGLLIKGVDLQRRSATVIIPDATSSTVEWNYFSGSSNSPP